jgi:tetratricopeptide (TPR) repeat protein
MTRYLLCLWLAAILSVGCAKRPNEFLDEARAKIAANDTVAAERTLKKGIEAFPDDGSLQSELAKLYNDTQRFDELLRYIEMNDVLFEAVYWQQAGEREFARKNWADAYRYFLKAGDSDMIPNPQWCSPSAMTMYRNALASSVNGSRASNESYLFTQMLAIVENCTRCVTCDETDVARVAALADEAVRMKPD